MRGIWATLTRELRAYFVSPLAYVILTFFLLVNGWVFYLIVSFLNDPMAPGSARPLDLFFGQTWLFWLILIFVCPIITMRLVSEERKSGTLEMLMTAPVTEGQVVLGKFLAALAFYIFLWLPTLAYAGILAYYSEVDWGPVAAGYLGILGIGALFLAAGLLASALVANQIVAAIFAFAILLLLLGVAFLENLFSDPALKAVFGYLNLSTHMADFSKGIVDTRRLVYYVSGTAFCLFVASRALAVKKWR